MKSFDEYGMSFEDGHVFAKVQAQSNDWMKTAADMANCRDFAGLVKLQFEFSKRSMERWLSIEPPTEKSAKKGIAIKTSATAEPKMEAKTAKTADVLADASTIEPGEADIVGARPVHDLTTLKGIGPAMARKLNAMGINSFDDVVSMTAEKIDEVEDSIGFKGRIRRDDWQGQARALLA